jgi:hypothetical protein
MSDWPHSPVHRLAEVGAYMVSLRGDQCGVLKPPSHIQAEGFPYRRVMISKIRSIEPARCVTPVTGELKAASSRRTPRRAPPANVQTSEPPCGGARNGQTSSSRTGRTDEHQGQGYFVAAAIALSISPAAESINAASSFNTFATTTICSPASFHFLSSIASRTAGMVLTP